MELSIVLKLIEGQLQDGRSAEDMFGTVQTGNILLADRGPWHGSQTPTGALKP